MAVLEPEIPNIKDQRPSRRYRQHMHDIHLYFDSRRNELRQGRQTVVVAPKARRRDRIRKHLLRRRLLHALLGRKHTRIVEPIIEDAARRPRDEKINQAKVTFHRDTDISGEQEHHHFLQRGQDKKVSGPEDKARGRSSQCVHHEGSAVNFRAQDTLQHKAKQTMRELEQKARNAKIEIRNGERSLSRHMRLAREESERRARGVVRRHSADKTVDKKVIVQDGDNKKKVIIGEPRHPRGHVPLQNAKFFLPQTARVVALESGKFGLDGAAISRPRLPWSTTHTASGATSQEPAQPVTAQHLTHHKARECSLPGFVFFPRSPFFKDPEEYRPPAYGQQKPAFNPQTGIWKVKVDSDPDGHVLFASEDLCWLGKQNPYPPEPDLPLPVRRRFDGVRGQFHNPLRIC